MDRFVIYVEGVEHARHASFAAASEEAVALAPACVQEIRTGTTPGSRRRTWIAAGVSLPIRYMGGQDPVGEA